jgi:uncharacterized membrane protein
MLNIELLKKIFVYTVVISVLGFGGAFVALYFGLVVMCLIILVVSLLVVLVYELKKRHDTLFTRMQKQQEEDLKRFAHKAPTPKHGSRADNGGI